MTMDQFELDAIVDDVGAAIRRDFARRRRRNLTVFAVAAVMLVMTSIGLAGTFDDWWTGGEPAVHQAAVDEAMHENDGLIPIDLGRKATVARIADAQLVAVATRSGGYCLTAFHDNRMTGSSCSDEPVRDDGTASAYETRTSAPQDPASRQFWIGYGRVTDAGAASVDLSSVGLSGHVPLERGGFFLFDIPREAWSQINERHGTITIKDASGATLRKGCIYTGTAPGKWYSGGGVIGGASDSCDVPSPAASLPHPDLAAARKLVTIELQHDHNNPTLVPGAKLSIWEAPEPGGKTCTFDALADRPPTPAYDMEGNPVPGGANPVHVSSCAKPGEWSFPTEITAGCDATLVAEDHYAGLCRGSVKPGSGIVSVELVGAQTTTKVAFAGGAFITELPDRPRAGKGPGPIPGGPYSFVGLDAHGAEVASVRIPNSG